MTDVCESVAWAGGFNHMGICLCRSVTFSAVDEVDCRAAAIVDHKAIQVRK